MGTILLVSRAICGVGASSARPGIVWITGGLPSVPNDDAEVGDGCISQMTVSNGLVRPMAEPLTRLPCRSMAMVPSVVPP